MEVQDLEQQASVVDQLRINHHTLLSSVNDAIESGGTVPGKHNGLMDEDDLGPETDVDSGDDVLLSPSIAAAKAMVSQTQPNSAAGEEVKSYVADNDIGDSEESEEEWNYIPGKENQNQVQQIQKELNAEEKDMESQLNPNAAEFVPIRVPPRIAALERDLSSSPAKGAEQSLENIDVPTSNEFYSEISKRPSELESLNQDTNAILNETNGLDITGISTKAVYGGDDSFNFLSNSTVVNNGDEDDDVAVPLNDTNPFSPTHVATESVNDSTTDTIQEKMVQDHFSLGFKPFDPMTQSVMEDEGQHEDETSPDIDFMSSDKPDLLSPEINQMPIGGPEGNEALEAQTSSSGFDSESGPDDGDHIPADQCNLAAAAATVGISFGDDINIDDIVNTKSISLIDDSHPIEKIEQTISPSVSPMPQQTVQGNVELAEVQEEVGAEEVIHVKEMDTVVEIQEVKENIKSDLIETEEILSQSQEIKEIEAFDPPKADEILLQFTDENLSSPTVNSKAMDTTIPGTSSIEAEIFIKSPEQVVDLVQELQFNQEPTLPNRYKEEEPESDSGFEIINASEASNEPDLIETEVTNKLQQNEEELVHGLVSNNVPDLLLQPSEPETDRQLSPIGTGTGNIIADIEGAMLESFSPTEQKVLDQSSAITVETPINEFIKEEPKSPVLFEENKELIESALRVVEHEKEITEKTETLIETKELSELISSNVPDLLLQPSDSETDWPKENNAIKQLSEECKERLLEFSAVGEVKEVIKEALNTVGEDKCLEMGESPVVEESPSLLINEGIDYKKLVGETELQKEELFPRLTETKEESTVGNQVVLEVPVSPLPVDGDKLKDEEICLPAQPTPPSTPAPGVTEEDKQELLVAAIAAAGVAATGAGLATVAVSETSKLEEKISSVQKKPTATSVTATKKPEVSKTTSAKPSSVASKSSVKPSASTTTAKKPPTSVGAAAKTTKPASTLKSSAPSSKPSTPTSKVAPTSRPPSAKPSTPTTTKAPTSIAAAKSPPKPRAPTAKPTSITAAKVPATTTAPKAATKTPATAMIRPTSATTAKKPEPTTASRKTTSTVSSSAAKPTAPSAVSKTAAPLKTVAAASTKPTAPKPGSASGSRPAPTKTISLSTATKTSTTTTAKPAAKTTASSTTSATKTATTLRAALTKTAPTKSGTATSAAAAPIKAPLTKAKPAAPTAIKKPLSADKNSKDATNNKLSAAKQQSGAIKKPDTKTKPNETKLIEPLTQEPLVTTTNGHVENGISNEQSSPLQISYPQIVQALN